MMLLGRVAVAVGCIVAGAGVVGAIWYADELGKVIAAIMRGGRPR